MTLPSFSIEDDPGPNFAALIKGYGIEPLKLQNPVDNLAHGTTCVAIRFKDGVILAGDRRATSGHHISHRTLDKVFQSDTYSGVAISGAAGPAIEMVKLFQLQLEHYEKVEGKTTLTGGESESTEHHDTSESTCSYARNGGNTSICGIRYERKIGRIFQYDVTGGRYEEKSFATTGSGDLHATTVIKLGFQSELSLSAATELSNAIFEASEEDSATGGPDLIRDVFPTISSITQDGFSPVPHSDVSAIFNRIIENRISRNGDLK